MTIGLPLRGTNEAAVVSSPADHHLTDHRSCASEFSQIRMESHRAPGILQQLRLAAWYGLTCKLYTLSSRVEAVKIKIEVCLECSPLPSYPIINEERL